MAALRQEGGASGNIGNVTLRQHLDWDEDFYWKVQGKLIELGKIVPGKGRGGSVRLTDAEGASRRPSIVSALKKVRSSAPEGSHRKQMDQKIWFRRRAC
jgi:hypothetical protein